MNNRTELGTKQIVKSIKQFLKASEWMTVVLCLLVIVCYGIYLLQVYTSAINYALRYSQYINQTHTLASLYLFGKLGLIAFTMIESGILLGYKKSRVVKLKEFFYLMALILISNLSAYALISYLVNMLTPLTGG